MVPGIFINCSRFPFIDHIISYNKIYETRSRDTLSRFVGKRVYLVQTGKGKPVVRCSCVIRKAFPLENAFAWNMFRRCTMILPGSPFDWKPDTRRKWLYWLTDIQPVSVPVPVLASAVRHGRIWVEIDSEEV